MQSQALIYCSECGSTEHESDEDGCYYCSSCGAIIPDLRVTDVAFEDISHTGIGGEGGIYSMRHKINITSSQQSVAMLPTREEVLRGLSQVSMTEEQREREREQERELKKGYEFEDRIYEPQDFGWKGHPSADSLVNGIRLRYVQGVQLMLQLQCEALVAKHGVSPIICASVGGMWMRYVVASRVFDGGWANEVIEESEAILRMQSGEGELICKEPIKNKWEPHNLYGQRAIYIWLRALKKKIPLHSSLALLFLACHVSRQPVLPTDIVKWALENKLPYIAAFVEIDKLLGKASATCPLHSRTLFRPVKVVGAWTLETAAGFIADTIGLHLAPVNFYSIANRYLAELCIPLEHALKTACRVYEWSMPVELCLSRNHTKLPTRVYVMAILIVVIRLLYNIQGQGVWEASLSNLHAHNIKNNRLDCVEQNMNQTYHRDVNRDYNDTTDDIEMKQETAMQGFPQHSDNDTAKLLCNLEKIYQRTTTKFDYLKDFKTYLSYCKDVVSAGISKSCEEENLMERFWNMYKDDIDGENEKLSGSNDLKQKRFREADMAYEDHKDIAKRPCANEYMDTGWNGSRNTISAKEAALLKMRSDMELNGFNYCPPKHSQSYEKYCRYRRKRMWGKSLFVAHADYYILLRTCAKVCEIDCRIMHLGVLLFESKLVWLEKRIGKSLASLRDGSLESTINLCNGKEELYPVES